MGLCAVSDLVLAETGAKFGFTEVRLGILPAVISPFVIAKIGESHARALFPSGKRFDATRALRIGLVHEVFEGEGALDAAVDAAVDGPAGGRTDCRARGEGHRARGARAAPRVDTLAHRASHRHSAHECRGAGRAAGVPREARAGVESSDAQTASRLVALAVAALIVTTSASDADAAKRRNGARADEPSIFVRVAVLLINFTNQPSEPWAKEDVDRLFFSGERSVAATTTSFPKDRCP